MTGYVSLDAYEQFCEDYLEDTDYSSVLSSTAKTAAEVAKLEAAKLKGEKLGELLDIITSDGLKGGLIGAGAVGAGVLGAKGIKKLIKHRKNKKPFKKTQTPDTTAVKNPTFSEYDEYNEFSGINRQLRKIDRAYNSMRDRGDAYKAALKAINKELKGTKKIYRKIAMSDMLDNIKSLTSRRK